MAITGESFALPTFPPPLELFSEVFRLRGVTLTRLQGLLGVQRVWDCTNPVMGCLGEEPKVGKQRDDSVLGRNEHGKTTAIVTRGTDHL